MKKAIILPGIGYTPEKPLLYYSRKLAQKHDFEIEIIRYDSEFDCQRKKNMSLLEKANLLYENAIKKLDSCNLSAMQGDDDCIIFFSKSIGTMIAARYAKENNLLCGHVFFTPLPETFKYVSDGYGIAFAGTDDNLAPFDDIEKECEQNHIELYPIEGANHSLETGEVIDDIDFIADIMEVVDTYIDEYE